MFRDSHRQRAAQLWLRAARHGHESARTQLLKLLRCGEVQARDHGLESWWYEQEVRCLR